MFFKHDSPNRFLKDFIVYCICWFAQFTMPETFHHHPSPLDARTDTERRETPPNHNERLRTQECDLFEEEATEIRTAREVLMEYNPYIAREVFRPAASTERAGTLDEMDMLDFSRKVIRFYNSASEPLFKKTAELLTPQLWKDFIQNISEIQNATSELFYKLDRISDHDFILFANAYTKLLKLANTPITIVEDRYKKPQRVDGVLSNGHAFPFIQDHVNGKTFLRPISPVLQQMHRIDALTKVSPDDENNYADKSSAQESLPEHITDSDAFSFLEAIERDDLETICGLILRHSFASVNSDSYQKALSIAKSLRDTLRALDTRQPDTKLPESAQELSIYHLKFNKYRKISPFTSILKNKLSRYILWSALNVFKQPALNPDELGKSISALVQEAHDLYTTTVQNGVPVLTAFAEYLRDHASDGEFHIGRDTEQTTYVASKALTWGQMDPQRRKQVIKHVDISRPVIARAGGFLRCLLKQEGIVNRMIGADGGWEGSGLVAAFKAMDMYITPERIDRQTKIISTNERNRRNERIKKRLFDPDNHYYAMVEWMEQLPKFTQRAEDIARIEENGVTKYLVVTQTSSEKERLLAWVVQHAVWREITPKSPNDARTIEKHQPMDIHPMLSATSAMLSALWTSLAQNPFKL